MWQVYTKSVLYSKGATRARVRQEAGNFCLLLESKRTHLHASSSAHKSIMLQMSFLSRAHRGHS